MRLAVFDIGSNSVKSILAETQGADLRVERERSLTTRLAANLIDTCELRPDAMARTLAALATLRQEAAEFGATHFRAVATSAVRDSRNRREFLRQARTALGFPVRLLSGEEEAETIFAGVSADPFWAAGELLVVDVGGGSTEWVQGAGGRLERRISLPLGALRLAERFIPSYPVSLAQAKQLVATVAEQLRAPLGDFTLGRHGLVGTGGTATSLAAIEQRLDHFDPQAIDHTVLRRDRVEALLARFTDCTLEDVKNISGLPAKRADLIVPGTAVLLATMERLGATQLQISIRGLRYGVLTALWRELSTPDVRAEVS